jgi:hypothetical protein
LDILAPEISAPFKIARSMVALCDSAIIGMISPRSTDFIKSPSHIRLGQVGVGEIDAAQFGAAQIGADDDTKRRSAAYRLVARNMVSLPWLRARSGRRCNRPGSDCAPIDPD